MDNQTRFPRLIFLIAGIWGVIIIAGRLATLIAVFGAVDLLLGILFTVAYFNLGKRGQAIAKAH